MNAMFGAGCFWGVEAFFAKIPGVIKTLVGYAGGSSQSPTYKDVCTGRTGHAEVVYIEFDPQVISYENLLSVFWNSHDATTLNRQGPDIGTQYRSVIFYYDEEQRSQAVKSLAEHQENLKSKITTEITTASTFYKAEDYHQKYFEKHGISCHR